MVKLVKNNGQYKLTVPVDLVRDKGWDTGTRFRFVEDTDGNITLKVISAKEKPVTEYTEAKTAKPRVGKQ